MDRKEEFNSVETILFPRIIGNNYGSNRKGVDRDGERIPGRSMCSSRLRLFFRVWKEKGEGGKREGDVRISDPETSRRERGNSGTRNFKEEKEAPLSHSLSTFLSKGLLFPLPKTVTSLSLSPTQKAAFFGEGELSARLLNLSHPPGSHPIAEPETGSAVLPVRVVVFPTPPAADSASGILREKWSESS